MSIECIMLSTGCLVKNYRHGLQARASPFRYHFIHKEKRAFQFWQPGFHPIELSTEEVFYQKLEYIHQNPVVAGFVNAPEDWVI